MEKIVKIDMAELETRLISKISQGDVSADIHQETADCYGITRKEGKKLNFRAMYSGTITGRFKHR